MIGERLGPYRIDRDLGSGGMGKVYAAVVVGRAPGIAEGTVVALKVVHPHLLETPGFFKRFLREAEIGKSVVHVNVVRTYDCDAVRSGGEDRHYLVMEYVEGQTLRDLLRDLDRVPEELCRHIGREVAKGLAAIHAAGVIHRDMKPENVLITKDNVVKVMDLGVARLNDEALRLSQTGAFVGSIPYAAPECFTDGGRNADGRADLHALGLVLYELSCGINPYLADDVPQILKRILHEEPRRLGDVNPQLSPFFEEVVHSLLAKKPAERFADAGTLLGVLQEGESSAWWRARAKAIRAVTKRPLRRIRIPRETAVYGREHEIAKLRALYEKAKSGEGQVVLVEGEAGIGKSRVVDELIGRLQRDGEDLNFLFGSYPPGGAATASGAFSTAYREQFGDADLEETLKSYLCVTPVLVPAFAALLRGETTPTGVEPLTKDSLQTVFVQATRALAAERTTVVLIDDLHFAPEEGRALFAALALGAPGHRILLVGTTRPGGDEKWRSSLDRVGVARLPLPRLSPKDLARLLVDAFHSERLAEELSFKIAAKSDGNPFFVFEILRGLREGQFITKRDDGTWVSTRVIADIQIPSSVLDLVNARVADLSEGERDLLDVACCWGFEFDPALVAAAIGLEPVPALKQFGQIERKHRLARSVGRHYVFDHHQVQEALYGALNEQLRDHYHAALASALETRTKAAEKDSETLDGALCVDLCEHLLKGAQGARALRYLDAALTHLDKGYLHDASIRLAERALAVPGLLTGIERARTVLRLCGPLGPLDRSGRRARQEEAAREAERLAAEAADEWMRGQAALALGWVLMRTERYAEAEAAIRRGQATAIARGDPKDEAAAARGLGNVFLSQSRFAEARQHYERSLPLSREIGDRQGEAGTTVNLGHVFRAQSRLVEAREQYERGLAICREIGHRPFEANALMGLGGVSLDQGLHAEAREHLERALTIQCEVGTREGEALVTQRLASLFLAQGRLAEAREHSERSLALSREIGNRVNEAAATWNLHSVFRSQGRFAAAREHLERALALSREIGYRQGEAAATGSLGDLLRYQGRLTEAREHLERALALTGEIGDRNLEALALHSLGNVLREEGETVPARERLLACIALSEELGFRDVAAEAHLSLGALRAATGDPEAARVSFAAARDLAAVSGVVDVDTLARCHLACLPGGDAQDALAAFTANEERLDVEERREARWLLWRASGDPAHLAEAKRLLDEALTSVPTEYREAMRTNVRLHHEIAAAAMEAGLRGAIR